MVTKKKEKNDIGFILGVVFLVLVTIYSCFLQNDPANKLIIENSNSVTGAFIGGTGNAWLMPFLVLGAFLIGLFSCKKSCKK